MLNKEKHQLLMGQILRDIYTDTSLVPLLGFKGGTCAYFFYNLSRFSVDLDFDLLSFGIDKQSIFDKIVSILGKYGRIKDSYLKQNTVFALLSYGDEDHNIKVEISTREDIPKIRKYFVQTEYLGISMFAAKKDYLFASKISALTLRTETAMRDVYDIYYFAKNNWGIDKSVLELRTGKKFTEQISDCIALVESIKDSKILDGLGELVDDKEKDWIKAKLRKEVVFYLKNYLAVLG